MHSIQSFFDESTSTATHVVWCASTLEAAVIDSVRDYDAKASRTSTASADKVLAFIQSHRLVVRWHLETHAHADHFSAAPYLKQHLGGQIAMGSGICEVQRVFKRLFNAADMATDGKPFDHLFEDGERFMLGQVPVRVMATPGHTPACVSYLVGHETSLDVFVGDTLFMPDYGSARCDFPGGDAHTLYQSIRKLLSLPPTTQLHLCHDYRPNGRAAQWQCTVADQRAHNVHVNDSVSEDAFVAMRHARDKTLGLPALMLPSVQVNVRAGHLPAPDDNGVSYLKIPINVL
jgi:glyoxylase-like metal-dependent hydrolase (beta-lactamase superfamily II)